MATWVPEGQKCCGRQSARVLLNQCQAPVTGVDVVTFSARSTPARALRATGWVNFTDIGIATPTVAPFVGVIVSSSRGGPAGRVGEGAAVPVLEPVPAPGVPPTEAPGEEARADEGPGPLALPAPPWQAVAPSSTAAASNTAPMCPACPRRPWCPACPRRLACPRYPRLSAGPALRAMFPTLPSSSPVRH